MSKLSRCSLKSISAPSLSPKSLIFLLVICLFALTGAVLAQEHTGNDDLRPSSPTSPSPDLEAELPNSWVLPILPAITREDSITLEWTGETPSGTTITGYDIWYRLDGGEWKFWAEFASAPTNARFTFPNDADGLYDFEATTYNDVPLWEPRTGKVEASVIRDKQQLFEMKLRLPLVGAGFQQ
jgi:hypothetical protein